MKKIPVHKNKSLKDLKGEQWREIPYTEGYYVVSNLGRVKALARVVYSGGAPNGRWLKERVLAQSISKNNNRYIGESTYELAVTYQFEGTRTTSMVRRLVYEAFILPGTKQKMDGKLVFPLDGNGFNCRASNLGLATRTELRLRDLQNNRYIPPFHLLPKEYYVKLAVAAGRGRRKKINKYKPDGLLVASYPSITTAAKKNRVSIGCVGLCVQKKLKLLKGHVYRYADEGYEGELRGWTGPQRRIIQYNIAGKKLTEFKSINEAARRLNIAPGTISRTAKKRSKHAGGFIWRYEGEPYKGEYYKHLKKRKFTQYTTDGKPLKTFDSISSAAKKTNCSYEGIRLTLQGKSKSCNGYIWKWK